MDSDAKQIHLRTEDGLVILRAVTEEVARFWVEVRHDHKSKVLMHF